MFNTESAFKPGVRKDIRPVGACAHGHILVAEDNAVNQKVAVRLLEKLGYQADVAANGLEVLEAMSRMTYMVVLMDCHMPEMDGFEATAEIRKREGSARHTPIIAVTANAMYGERERCLAGGMDDYLSKPVKQEELAATIKRWLPGQMPPQPSVTNSTHDESTKEVQAALQGLCEEFGPEMAIEIVELFLDDTVSQLSALREGLTRLDARAVARTAHSLKGSCGNVGASAMVGVCLQLENLSTSGTVEGVAPLLAQLETDFVGVRRAAERFKPV